MHVCDIHLNEAFDGPALVERCCIYTIIEVSGRGSLGTEDTTTYVLGEE